MLCCRALISAFEICVALAQRIQGRTSLILSQLLRIGNRTNHRIRLRSAAVDELSICNLQSKLRGLRLVIHRFSGMQWLLILVLASSIFVAATSLTLEERVEKLEKDHVSKRLFLLIE